jgi:hypothetical protein
VSSTCLRRGRLSQLQEVFRLRFSAGPGGNVLCRLKWQGRVSSSSEISGEKRISSNKCGKQQINSTMYIRGKTFSNGIYFAPKLSLETKNFPA